MVPGCGSHRPEAARYGGLKVGPALADLDVGPLISARQQGIVSSFLDRGAVLEKAAEAELSGTPEGGSYVRPTLFGNVAPDHVLARDEIFGRFR